MNRYEVKLIKGNILVLPFEVQKVILHIGHQQAIARWMYGTRIKSIEEIAHDDTSTQYVVIDEQGRELHFSVASISKERAHQIIDHNDKLYVQWSTGNPDVIHK